MNLIQNFPFFSIIACLLCALVTFAARQRVGHVLTMILLVVNCLLHGSVLLYNLQTGDNFFYMMGHYPAPWGNEVMAGVLEPAMALLFSFVILLSIIAGERHIHHDIHGQRRKYYWVMVDMTLVSLLALCYTNDIFTGYVFIEICTLASCGILCVREGGRSLLASVRYMVFSLVGSGLFLIGVVFLYAITGHLLFPQLHDTIQALWATGDYYLSFSVAIASMTAGLAIKSGCFPFHAWLPDAHSQATVSSSCILSGVIVKGYAVLLLKIIFRVLGPQVYVESGAQYILLIMGVAGMVACSIMAVTAKKIKVMIAYSSAAQIGYIFMGFGMGTTMGFLASLLQIVNHAVTKPMLFLTASQLSDASHMRMDFPALRGAGHRNVPAGIAFTVGSLSMVGIPLLGGFVPKLYFATEAFSLGWQKYLILGALAISTVLNVLYFLYTAIVLWLPEKDDHTYKIIKPTAAQLVPVYIFVACNLALGLCSGPLVELFRRALELLAG